MNVIKQVAADASIENYQWYLFDGKQPIGAYVSAVKNSGWYIRVPVEYVDGINNGQYSITAKPVEIKKPSQ